MPRLRWVLDTNVVVSAMLWGGRPGDLLTLAGEGRVRLFASKHLLDELRATLAKPRLVRAVEATGRKPAELVTDYRGLLTMVRPHRLESAVSRDPDDDAVIACALAAKADAIVTGDDDLLVLGAVGGVDIKRVSDAALTLE